MLAHVDMYFCGTGSSYQWDNTLFSLSTFSGSETEDGETKGSDKIEG
ncbi:hypothetical protein SLEP1_g27761 [Rubroshorea leprosula]|uniref:Uncharacterized protein n=1 Tax=Rubroshorea leprosula TaxID=152421 RepID=A0AAV5JRF0_9ROSI|nr:hypothetical protein SLEP1_g27761 [Rubroshorea leprosula]